MIDVSKAESIEGWMSPSELRWLAEQAMQHSMIVEIGSYKGRSTRALGDYARGWVVAIDTWTGPVGANEREALPSFFDSFKTNLADLIEKDKVIPYKSTDILSFQGGVDMVFIDGDHVYDGVKKDIESWLPRLSPKGLICGHDASYPDVARAVTELVPNARKAAGTDIWFANV